MADFWPLLGAIATALGIVIPAGIAIRKGVVSSMAEQVATWRGMAEALKAENATLRSDLADCEGDLRRVKRSRNAPS